MFRIKENNFLTHCNILNQNDYAVICDFILLLMTRKLRIKHASPYSYEDLKPIQSQINRDIGPLGYLRLKVFRGVDFECYFQVNIINYCLLLFTQDT